MNSILERLVSQLMAKGMTRQNAISVATRRLQQSGNLDSRGKPTAKGTVRGMMTPEQRAIDRAIKERGGSYTDYVYDPKTNRATKRK